MCIKGFNPVYEQSEESDQLPYNHLVTSYKHYSVDCESSSHVLNNIREPIAHTGRFLFLITTN